MTAKVKYCGTNEKTNARHYSFTCPACDDIHQFIIGGNYSWEWNGSFESPTLNPSLLVKSGHYSTKDGDCWCDYNEKQIKQGLEPSGFHCYNCHSFIRDGMIEFLSDCSHHLAGKTVPLLDIEGGE